ncbi:MAG: divalent-cation tolerance protein CutA [Elusimicrobia bacterium]|nr:divalent-cation tolerance protein CutA [Elusimicrobiota bacterium]
MAACYQAILITVPDRKTGLSLARGLVGRGLAACVNMIPGIRSVYRWQGKVEESPEHLLVAKTRRSLLKKLTAFVRGHHPYAVPEVVALPILGGNPDYLAWLGESISSPDRKR